MVWHAVQLSVHLVTDSMRPMAWSSDAQQNWSNTTVGYAVTLPPLSHHHCFVWQFWILMVCHTSNGTFVLWSSTLVLGIWWQGRKKEGNVEFHGYDTLHLFKVMCIHTVSFHDTLIVGLVHVEWNLLSWSQRRPVFVYMLGIVSRSRQ